MLTRLQIRLNSRWHSCISCWQNIMIHFTQFKEGTVMTLISCTCRGANIFIFLVSRNLNSFVALTGCVLQWRQFESKHFIKMTSFLCLWTCFSIILISSLIALNFPALRSRRGHCRNERTSPWSLYVGADSLMHLMC